MEMQIKLATTQDVKEFVELASKCEFDIDISYNRVIVDAKSILGILSMDLRKELKVRCNGESTEFAQAIEKFKVKQAVA